MRDLLFDTVRKGLVTVGQEYVCHQPTFAAPILLVCVLQNPSMQRKLDDALGWSDLFAVLRSVKHIEAAPEASHKLLHVQVMPRWLFAPGVVLV